MAPCPLEGRLTIASFSDFECESEFRFTKSELKRLCRLLKFDDKDFSNNRSKFPGENLSLRGLYKLSSVEVYHKVLKEFERDTTEHGRAFNFFDYMYDNYSHLENNNLEWWFRNGFCERSAAAIEARIAER